MSSRFKSRRYVWYGDVGAGKTLCAVRYAAKFRLHFPQFRIFSNIPLNFSYVPINSAEILFEINEPCFLLMDELWHLADSRKGNSVINDVMNMLLLRSRKRHWVVAYTQQWYTQTDLRIRYITQFWCEPEIRGNVCIQKFLDKHGNFITTKCFDVRKIFKFYNTEDDPFTLNIDALRRRWEKYRREQGYEGEIE